MIITTINIKITLISLKRNQVHKRFMMTRRGVGYIPNPVRAPHNIQSPTANLREYAMQKRNLTYHVDKTNVDKSSHEQAKANPLLGKIKKTFQHPFIGRDICENVDCPNKICSNPCEAIKEHSYVGHGTHGNIPGAVQISVTDFQNKADKGPQNAKFYDQPIVNHDTTGANIDKQMTVNLNNNNNMLEEIHKHSSKKNLLQEYAGSDDIQNIN